MAQGHEHMPIYRLPAHDISAPTRPSRRPRARVRVCVRSEFGNGVDEEPIKIAASL